MAASAPSLKIFEDAIAHILAPLYHNVDNEAATAIILFALQAVGTDAAKLECLVAAVYNWSSLFGNNAADLPVNGESYGCRS